MDLILVGLNNLETVTFVGFGTTPVSNSTELGDLVG